MEAEGASEGWEKGLVWPGERKDRTEVSREARAIGSSGRDEWHRPTPSLARTLISHARAAEGSGVSPAAAQMWQRARQQQTPFA